VSANLDLVRSIYGDWERGDFRRVDWADPNIEFLSPDGPQPGAWRGRAEMMASFRDFLDAWEDFTVEVEDYRQLDDGCILALVRHSGHGKTSGVELAQVEGGANLLHFRDGKVVRFVAYWDRDRALADLGLEE
jgi:ketosteroid isomerase-like protein